MCSAVPFDFVQWVACCQCLTVPRLEAPAVAQGLTTATCAEICPASRGTEGEAVPGICPTTAANGACCSDALSKPFIREQSMWIDWRELPSTVVAFGFATAFIWGIAHLG